MTPEEYLYNSSAGHIDEGGTSSNETMYLFDCFRVDLDVPM